MNLEDVVALLGVAGAAVAAFAGLLTAVGTFLLAFFAYRAWSVARDTLEAARQSAVAGRDAAEQSRRTLLQMKADSEAMAADSLRNSRPYVYAEVVPSLFGIGWWDLVIENQGRSIARDVRMTIDCEFPEDAIGRHVRPVTEKSHTLLPSKRRRYYWRYDFAGQPVKGMPASTTMRLYYCDDAERPYEETIVLDEPLNPNATPSPRTGAKSGDETADGRLKDIRLALEAVTEHIGELRR